MDSDAALRFVETLLAEQNLRLNDTERWVFKGAWNRDTYDEIRAKFLPDKTVEHIKKNVGPDLWKLLSQVLGEKVSKSKLQGPIERAWNRAHPHLSPASPQTAFDPTAIASSAEADPKREDWYRLMPDVPLFVGRSAELDQLERQIRLHGCRLMALCGLGGMGKTALAAKLGQAVWDQFDVRIWRSIAASSAPPPLPTLVADLEAFLGDRSASSLLDQLRDRRCLIVLDGYEALLQSNVYSGAYRDGYAAYGQWLERLGHTMHQSCILLTTREEPKEIAALKERMAAVESFRVGGLGEVGVRSLFQQKGFDGSEGDWHRLMRRYDGNPDALNEIAVSIREWHNGDITAFLDESQDDGLLVEIRSKLDEQLARLSPLEQQIVDFLAQHEPADIHQIRLAARSLSRTQLGAALNSLQRRSIVHNQAAHYRLTRLPRRYLLDGNDDA